MPGPSQEHAEEERKPTLPLPGPNRQEASRARRAGPSAALGEFADRLLTLRTSQDVYTYALEWLLASLSCESAMLFVLGDDASVVVRLARWREGTPQERLQWFPEVAVSAAIKRGSWTVLDVTDEPVPTREEQAKWGALLVLPLSTGQRKVEALALARRGAAGFRGADVQRARLIAAQVSLRVDNLALQQQLQRRIELHRKLLAKAVSAQEDERKRIASDLHDAILQVLGFNLLKVDLCQRLWEMGERERALEELKSLRTSIEDSIRQLREVIFSLRPSTLDLHGLLPTMDAYLERFEADSGVHTRFSSRIGRRLDPASETLVYRLTQEALANVRKHAQATTVTISLTGEGRNVRLTIQDDGRGFSVARELERGLASGHMGLHSLQERIEMAGGSLSIESEPGRGTKLTFLLPR